jgi:hypothetical protein
MWKEVAKGLTWDTIQAFNWTEYSHETPVRIATALDEISSLDVQNTKQYILLNHHHIWSGAVTSFCF